MKLNRPKFVQSLNSHNRQKRRSVIGIITQRHSPRPMQAGLNTERNVYCDKRKAKAVNMRREYPEAPIVTVGGIVFNGDSVLLAQRGKEPNRGRWSLPGGAIELGETARQAVEREVREECGVVVQAGEVVEVLDILQRDPAGTLRFHYVVIDFLCRYVSGKLTPGDDAADVRWVQPGEFDTLKVFQRTRDVIAKARAML